LQQKPLTDAERKRLADLLTRADTHIKSRNAGAARVLYREALRLSPTSAEATWGLARCASVEGDMADAERYARAALQLDPKFGRAYLTLARVAESRGDRKQELEYYEKCIRLAPDFATPYLNIGKMLEDAEEWADAEKFYRAALERDPRLPMALSNLGHLFEIRTDGKADPAKSAEFYRRSLAVSPDFRPALVNVGAFHYNRKEYARAKPYYERLYRLESDNDEWPAVLGSIACHLDRPTEGAELYRRAIELDPRNGWYYVARAMCLSNAGRADAARESAKRGLELGFPRSPVPPPPKR
jgi:tetratricopeptide (TPR) repeat protein